MLRKPSTPVKNENPITYKLMNWFLRNIYLFGFKELLLLLHMLADLENMKDKFAMSTASHELKAEVMSLTYYFVWWQLVSGFGITSSSKCKHEKPSVINGFTHPILALLMQTCNYNEADKVDLPYCSYSSRDVARGIFLHCM